MDDRFDDPEYEVGYGKPPKQHQFKKGIKAAAGKRKRKGTKKVEAIIANLMNEKVTVLIDGKKVRMTRIEALIRKTFNDAGKSSRETLQLLKLIKELGIEDHIDEQVDEPVRKMIIEFVGQQVKPVHDTCAGGDMETDPFGHAG